MSWGNNEAFIGARARNRSSLYSMHVIRAMMNWDDNGFNYRQKRKNIKLSKHILKQ